MMAARVESPPATLSATVNWLASQRAEAYDSVRMMVKAGAAFWRSTKAARTPVREAPGSGRNGSGS